MAHQRRDDMPCAPMKYPNKGKKKKKPGNPHAKKRKPPKKKGGY